MLRGIKKHRNAERMLVAFGVLCVNITRLFLHDFSWPPPRHAARVFVIRVLPLPVSASRAALVLLPEPVGFG